MAHNITRPIDTKAESRLSCGILHGEADEKGYIPDCPNFIYLIILQEIVHVYLAYVPIG